jgi:hypothetical protein
MKKEEIGSFLKTDPSIQEMRRYAKMLGVHLKRTMGKKDIAKALAKISDKDVPVSSQTVVTVPSESKRPSKPVNVDLPRTYFADSITLHPVNPYWVYIKWDFSKETRERLDELGNDIFVRVSDITNIIYDGKNANRYKEAKILSEEGNWYFQVDFPDADYIAEIGYYTGGLFVGVMKSKIARTPRNTPQFADQETWVDLSKGSKKEVKVSTEATGISQSVRSSGPSDNPSSEEFIKSISKSRSGR